MKVKLCNRCNQEKSISEFSKKTSSKDGLMNQCKICRSKKEKEYRDLNTEKNKKRRKVYYENNKLKHKIYFLNRRNSDPLFKMKDNIRRRLNFFLKKQEISKGNKTFEIIGISPIGLKKYLEKKFVGSMSWENYGEWHIDHIIPISAADTMEDILKLCHYSNLQPLWAKDNLTKGNRII